MILEGTMPDGRLRTAVAEPYPRSFARKVALHLLHGGDNQQLLQLSAAANVLDVHI